MTCAIDPPAMPAPHLDLKKAGSSASRDRWLLHLVEEHGDSAYRTAFRILRDRDDANDAVQDALALAFRRWETLRSVDSVRSWFFRILVNQCISRQRKRVLRDGAMKLLGRQAPPPVQDPSVPTDFASNVLPHLLALPIKQRTAVILRFGDERSVAEISHAMGISDETTKTHIKRGLAQLRKRIATASQGDAL